MRRGPVTRLQKCAWFLRSSGLWRGVFGSEGPSTRTHSEDRGSTESALAVARSLVATVSLLAAYVNLIEPARHAWVCDVLLIGYAMFAFGVLALARRSTWLAPSALHGVDLCFAALLTF